MAEQQKTREEETNSLRTSLDQVTGEKAALNQELHSLREKAASESQEKDEKIKELVNNLGLEQEITENLQTELTSLSLAKQEEIEEQKERY